MATNLRPREYQRAAISAAWAAYQSGAGRAHVVMATGLGKSYTAWWFAQRWLRDNPGKRMLALVDKQEPTEQNRKTFGEICREEFTTGIRHARHSEHLDARVIFTTFDSVDWLIRNAHLNPAEVGLVFVDESHHAPAETYRPVVELFTNAFLYGTTATNEREDDEDPNDLFGLPVFSLPLVEGLQQGYLCQVDYFLLMDTSSRDAIDELHRQVIDGDDRMVSRDKITRAVFGASDPTAVVTKVREYQARGFKRTLIFCRDVRHAEQAATYFPGSEAFHSQQVRNKEEQTPLDRFRSGSTQELVVVDMVNEAVDVPEVDLVVFWRGTESKRLWHQQLGRGLRRAKGKAKVTVLDFVGNIERILWLSELQDKLGPVFGGNGGGRGSDRHHGGKSTSSPAHIQLTDELQDLLEVLKALNRDPYHTMAEAMEALQRLDPPHRRLQEWYRDNYKRDPRLPASPHQVYAQRGWISWKNFFQTGIYETIEEARAAVQKLTPPKNCSRADWYGDNYMRDPRLPSNPQKHYADRGWQGWQDFFGASPYKTFAQAKLAIALYDRPRRNQNLEEYYKKLQLLDPRLPNRPGQWYKRRGYPKATLRRLFGFPD